MACSGEARRKTRSPACHVVPGRPPPTPGDLPNSRSTGKLLTSNLALVGGTATRLHRVPVVAGGSMGSLIAHRRVCPNGWWRVTPDETTTERLSGTMEIAVLVKQVPDTYSERRLRGSDWVVDRDGSDAVIDEIDSKGVEIGLQLTELHGGEVTVVTMGPARAGEALRKALAMGAHKAIHVVDDALAGSDGLQTSAALAAGRPPGGFD